MFNKTLINFQIILLTLFGVFLVSSPQIYGQDAAENSLARYGTTSQEAADQIAKGLRAFKAKNYKASLAAFERAAKLDPNCQLAFFWLAQSHELLGDRENEMAAYNNLFNLRSNKTNVLLEGCLNAALSLSHRGKLEESTRWFSRVIRLDPTNKFKLAAKAYKNLAITRSEMKEPGAAVFAATLGNLIDSKVVPPKMLDELNEKSKREVATILEADTTEQIEFQYRDELGVDSGANLIPEINFPVRDLTDLHEQKMLAVLPEDGKFFYLADYQNDELKLTKVKTQGRPKAAVYIGGKLYLSITSPNRIAEFDVSSMRETKKWRLRREAPSNFAIAPAQNSAFYVAEGVITTLNLESLKETHSDFSVNRLGSDPTQKHLFAFKKPSSDASQVHGQFLIRGRPIQFAIEDESMESDQSTLFRFEIVDGHLLPSQIRLNSASNASALEVSPDGKMVAIVGGGGWRPAGNSSRSGYGVTFFEATDFSHVVRFVWTGAYPSCAAINPQSHLIFAAGKHAVVSHAVNDDDWKIELRGDIELSKFSGDGRLLFLVDKDKMKFYQVRLKVHEKDNQDWAAQLLSAKTS